MARIPMFRRLHASLSEYGEGAREAATAHTRRLRGNLRRVKRTTESFVGGTPVEHLVGSPGVGRVGRLLAAAGLTLVLPALAVYWLVKPPGTEPGERAGRSRVEITMDMPTSRERPTDAAEVTARPPAVEDTSDDPPGTSTAEAAVDDAGGTVTTATPSYGADPSAPTGGEGPVPAGPAEPPAPRPVDQPPSTTSPLPSTTVTTATTTSTAAPTTAPPLDELRRESQALVDELLETVLDP